jgi:hypothetical protein
MKIGAFCDVARVALVRTDVSEERIISIIKMTMVIKLGTTSLGCYLMLSFLTRRLLSP